MTHAIYDTKGQIVDGWLGVTIADDSSWFGGWDRPINVVENEDEIDLLFKEVSQPTCECGYCGDKFRTRTKDKALRWFQAHDCGTLQKAEAAGIVWDLAA